MSTNIILGAGEKYVVACTSALTVTGSISDCMGRVFKDVRQVISFGEGCTIQADSYTTLDVPECIGKAKITSTESYFIILGVFLTLIAIAVTLAYSYKSCFPRRYDQHAEHAETPSEEISSGGGN